MTQQLLDKTSTPVGTVLRKIEGSLLQNDDDRPTLLCPNQKGGSCQALQLGIIASKGGVP